jgi:hypothetical protein
MAHILLSIYEADHTVCDIDCATLKVLFVCEMLKFFMLYVGS